MKPKDLLQWMERQGCIDLRMGKGEQTDFSNPPFQGCHAKWYVCRVTIYGPEDFVIDAETKELINHGKTLNLQ